MEPDLVPELTRVDEVRDMLPSRRIGPTVAVVAIWALALLAAPVPALAQADFTGNWGPRFHEDQPDRIPGPAIGDYAGLPLTEGARQFALSWDPARLTLPEQQCRVHVSPYIYRGPLQLRISEVRDPRTEELVAIVHKISTYDQERWIYMDGRPHPDEYAPHTWMGFSTGRWEGDRLVVRTTHIKFGWQRRNGVPQSDRATMTEHFVRMGDAMTRISVLHDPVYMTEPVVRSEEFVINTRQGGPLLYQCKPVEEVVWPRGAVPHYAIGENPFLEELQRNTNLPPIATDGGAATMYPEFRDVLRERGR